MTTDTDTNNASDNSDPPMTGIVLDRQRLDLRFSEQPEEVQEHWRATATESEDK
jgi:hypothetical protein